MRFDRFDVDEDIHDDVMFGSARSRKKQSSKFDRHTPLSQTTPTRFSVRDHFPTGNQSPVSDTPREELIEEIIREQAEDEMLVNLINSDNGDDSDSDDDDEERSESRMSGRGKDFRDSILYNVSATTTPPASASRQSTPSYGMHSNISSRGFSAQSYRPSISNTISPINELAISNRFELACVSVVLFSVLFLCILSFSCRTTNVGNAPALYFFNEIFSYKDERDGGGEHSPYRSDRRISASLKRSSVADPRPDPLRVDRSPVANNTARLRMFSPEHTRKSPTTRSPVTKARQVTKSPCRWVIYNSLCMLLCSLHYASKCS